MRSRIAPMLGIAAALTCATAQSATERQDFSRMHMILTRTFLKVKAVAVDVLYGEETKKALESQAAGKPYSDALADEIAKTALQSEDFSLRMTFLRDVGLDEFVSGTKDNVEHAYKSGVIPESERERVEKGTPQWYSALRDRGFKKGDEIIYVADGNHLQTIVRSRSGQTLVKHEEQGPAPRHTLLAGYLAPGTDFREDLIKSSFG